METDVTCVISGSFKYKPEIDALHDTFRDVGIRVLSPDKGWLYTPKLAVATGLDVRPLPSERDMPEVEIEQNFLRHLLHADFVYLHNQEGYVGDMAAFELGFALASDKPIYAAEELHYDHMKWERLDTFFVLKNTIKVVPIEEITQDFRVLSPTDEV